MSLQESMWGVGGAASHILEITSLLIDWNSGHAGEAQTQRVIRCLPISAVDMCKRCLLGLIAPGRPGTGLVRALRLWWQSKAVSENSGICCLQGSVLCRMPEGRINIVRPRYSSPRSASDPVWEKHLADKLKPEPSKHTAQTAVAYEALGCW